MNLNKVFVLGNLTRDPEKKNLPSGQLVASFGMATNSFFTKDGEKKQEVEFHNITTFGRLAEIASQYLKKGSLVLIEGRLRTRNWQDANGVKHYRTEITAQSMQLGPRAGSAPAVASAPAPAAASVPSSAPSPTPTVMPASAPKPVSQEEIPVIEEGTPMEKKPPASAPEETAAGREEKPSDDEIDVKNIPF